MGDLDTDPKMMRAQQDKDAAETIAPDETREAPKAGDTDAVSGAARKAAIEGRFEDGRDPLDVVFEANRAAVETGGETTERSPQERTAAEKASLAQPGRSRLGS